MTSGKTPIERKDKEKQNTDILKHSFGDNFTAKLKSTRRNSFRDWRKEMGPGSASLRRYKAKIANKMK